MGAKAEPAFSARSPEAELLLILVGTSDRRAACHDRVATLAHAADYEQLSGQLALQKLLPLVGSRLAEIAPDALPDWFSESIATSVHSCRVRAAMQQHVATELVSLLRAGGVEPAFLKGAPLAERLYGDAGMRPSNDIDLLVRPEHFDAAVRILVERGYARPRAAAWVDGLPLFETSIVPADNWLPPIDLHWRVHWYDRDFSAGLIDRVRDHDGLPCPVAEDELATMLLMFARDGFAGVRTAADVAGWWDANHASATPVLARVVGANPALARSCGAAAVVAERLVGVPAECLVPHAEVAEARGLPLRLQNWALEGGERERLAATTLVDWMLRPPGGTREFTRRHIFIPPGAVAEAYASVERSPLVMKALWLRYGLLVLARMMPQWARALWRTRGGRQLVAIPDVPLGR